ncbi:MAG: EAL domain-containing protein [Oscillospiraceae bacterium]|jgi:EAL domain-containing protein (putative c-di-GMP-specific phosphodiesterase class I)/GGDEF domain-containing protein/ligand-binding sensor protein|nr:EAL domain-containing protein [Oscillospiraceae bacterium]
MDRGFVQKKTGADPSKTERPVKAMAQDISLKKLLNLADIQQLQDSFAKITGISASVVDSVGNVLTRLSGYGANPLISGKDRQNLYRKLCQENRVAKKPTLTTSSHTGLSTCAVPIFLDNSHLGSWVIGPMILDSANREIFLQAVRDSDLSDEDASRLIERLPTVIWKEFELIVEFLQGLTGAVIQMARSNSDLKRSYSELLELNEKLDSTSQMMTTLANSADVGLYVVDFFTGELLQANEQFARYAGKPLQQLIGKPCWKWMAEDADGFCFDCPHNRLLDSRGQPRHPLISEKYLTKTDTWLRIAHQAVGWVDGRLAHMVTMLDITSNKKLQHQLSQYAFYDRGLRLPNDLRLAHDAAEWQGKEPVYLICYDVISLRNINDIYGRDTGDSLLASICEWIETMSVPGSCLYRISGDQFAFAVHGVGLEGAFELAGVIFNRFESPWSVTAPSGQKVSVHCGISMGVVCANLGLTEERDLLSIIQRTLSRSLVEDKVLVYGEDMDNEYKEQLRLEVSLENCVKNGMEGFSVHYQPIVDSATGAWCSLEALCRWESPEFGFVSPLVFIHKAEQLGLIIDIGNWVLETAVRACSGLGLSSHRDFILNVNISPLQIADDLLEDTVTRILKKYDYPAEKLSLEITETAEVSFTGQAVGTIGRLRKAGVKMALDDFGTGYSNFNNLHKLPVSILKTERAFLVDIEKDDYLQHLFYLMVELAHAAGMVIIVEGVETEEQMRIMLKNGVDRMQGYLFGKPATVDEIRDSLDNFTRTAITAERSGAERPELEQLLLHIGEEELSPHAYRLVGEAACILMKEPDPLEAVSRMLAHIGSHTRMSNVWLYRREGLMQTKRLALWSAKDETREMPPGLEELKSPYAWLNRFGEHGILVLTDCESVPEPLRGDLTEQGVRATCVFQIRDGERVAGYLGFDDCIYYRDWSAEELVLLYNISRMIPSRLSL